MENIEEQQVIYTEEDKCFILLSSSYIIYLSEKIKSSLEWYTENHATGLNRKLREDEKFNDNEIEYLKNIDIAFSNCPIYYKDLTIYRGTEHIISTDLFISCSIDILVAINFGKLRKITCKPGVKMINLEGISTHWNEKEILLDRTNMYDIEDDTNVTVISPKVDKNSIFLVKYVYSIILEIREYKNSSEYKDSDEFIFIDDDYILGKMKNYNLKDKYILNIIKAFI
jgi:hypothetical protein